jgi:hypothetical protein
MDELNEHLLAGLSTEDENSNARAFREKKSKRDNNFVC